MDGAPLDDGKAATSVEERKLTANLDVSSKTVPSSDQQVKISSGDPTANQPRDCFSKGNTNASLIPHCSFFMQVHRLAEKLEPSGKGERNMGVSWNVQGIVEAQYTKSEGRQQQSSGVPGEYSDCRKSAALASAEESDDKVSSFRKRNALYSKRNYYKTKTQFQDLRDSSYALRAENIELKEEKDRLEGLLAAANDAIASLKPEDLRPTLRGSTFAPSTPLESPSDSSIPRVTDGIVPPGIVSDEEDMEALLAFFRSDSIRQDGGGLHQSVSPALSYLVTDVRSNRLLWDAQRLQEALQGRQEDSHRRTSFPASFTSIRSQNFDEQEIFGESQPRRSSLPAVAQNETSVVLPAAHDQVGRSESGAAWNSLRRIWAPSQNTVPLFSLGALAQITDFSRSRPVADLAGDYQSVIGGSLSLPSTQNPSMPQHIRPAERLLPSSPASDQIVEPGASAEEQLRYLLFMDALMRSTSGGR